MIRTALRASRCPVGRARAAIAAALRNPTSVSNAKSSLPGPLLPSRVIGTVVSAVRSRIVRRSPTNTRRSSIEPRTNRGARAIEPVSRARAGPAGARGSAPGRRNVAAGICRTRSVVGTPRTGCDVRSPAGSATRSGDGAITAAGTTTSTSTDLAGIAADAMAAGPGAAIEVAALADATGSGAGAGGADGSELPETGAGSFVGEDAGSGIGSATPLGSSTVTSGAGTTGAGTTGTGGGAGWGPREGSSPRGST